MTQNGFEDYRGKIWNRPAMVHMEENTVLVLSRHRDEEIVITTKHGERITVTVVEIRDRDKVRLGFSADAETTIHRAEIQELIEQQRTRSHVEGDPDFQEGS